MENYVEEHKPEKALEIFKEAEALIGSNRTNRTSMFNILPSKYFSLRDRCSIRSVFRIEQTGRSNTIGKGDSRCYDWQNVQLIYGLLLESWRYQKG
jgi:hypothetical protein